MSVYHLEKPEKLERSILSMLNQTTKPTQIVIVEDGKLTNELNNVIDFYAEKYEAITIIKNDVNLGLGLALNEGLKHCKTELVARMDSDDISLPDRCERQLREFQMFPEIDIIGGYIIEFIDSPTNIVSKRLCKTNDFDIKREMKFRCPLNHQTVMFRKSKVILAGQYPNILWNEDYGLWINMKKTGCRFSNLSDPLVLVSIDKNTFHRRGGMKYFKSEKLVQKQMLLLRQINFVEYLYNIIVRFVVQVLLPNRVRASIYKLFLRKKA